MPAQFIHHGSFHFSPIHEQIHDNPEIKKSPVLRTRLFVVAGIDELSNFDILKDIQNVVDQINILLLFY